MSRLAAWREGLADGDGWRQGAQIAAAAVLSFALSSGLGLPDPFWAVLSALIVSRPDSGGTLSAAGARVGATLVGALCGLAGVALEHRGAGALPVTLGLMGLLAFASGLAPALRGAPIAALIVVGAAGAAGLSAEQVAAWRVGQIGLGAAVATGVALVASSLGAERRSLRAQAALLARLAAQARGWTATEPTAAQDASGAADGLRQAVVRVVLLAGAADRAARWPLAGRRGTPAADHQRRARLATRLVQDLAVLGRLAGLLRARPEAAAAVGPLAAAVATSIETAAQAASGSGAATAAVDAWLDGLATRPALAAWLGGPVRLLRADLEAWQPSPRP